MYNMSYGSWIPFVCGSLSSIFLYAICANKHPVAISFAHNNGVWKAVAPCICDTFLFPVCPNNIEE